MQSLTLQRQQLQLRVAQREPLALVGEPRLAAQQALDHAERQGVEVMRVPLLELTWASDASTRSPSGP